MACLNSKWIHFFTKKPILPKFLNTKEKWNSIVKNTDTSDKFEELILKIIDEEEKDTYVPINLYKIFKLLEIDIVKEHKSTDICKAVDLMEQMTSHLFHLMKGFKNLNEEACLKIIHLWRDC